MHSGDGLRTAAFLHGPTRCIMQIRLDIDPRDISTAQQRRWTRTGRTYMPAAVKQTHARYMDALAEYVPDEPMTGPLRVTCTIIYQARKRSESGQYRTMRPDLDNLFKGLADCITRSGIWKDDSQVADLRIIKRYALEGEEPGIIVDVCEMCGIC